MAEEEDVSGEPPGGMTYKKIFLSFDGRIPFIGQIWLSVELGLLKGGEGENAYGLDPLTIP